MAMAEKREIISCSIFGGQALYISRLWTPETTDYKSGKPLDKPRYSVLVRYPKTVKEWNQEKVFASVTDACRKIYAKHFSGMPLDRLIVPVKDGDQANAAGKINDWGKGHWWIKADTTSPDYLAIEAIQNGKPMELPSDRIGGRRIVKDGDFCILTVGLAKSEGRDPGIKTYLNAITFTGPGEEIKLGSRVSTEALLEQARAQGLSVQGYGAPAATPAAGTGFRDDDIPF
jgi:hypothetical protein